MNTDKDIISSVMEEFGLTMEDVKVLMKGYEKFTESSTEQKKELIDKWNMRLWGSMNFLKQLQKRYQLSQNASTVTMI